MRKKQLLYGLALFMACMGVVTWLRTGSFVPFIITGSIGLITGLLGLLVKRGSRTAFVAATGWLALITLLLGYQVFVTIGAHTNPRPGSKVIFGIMALAYLSCLVYFIVHPQSQPRSR